jgi:transcription initiation factor TFIIIB Brf1 subunit/transcription initiation factor TFIIB
MLTTKENNKSKKSNKPKINKSELWKIFEQELGDKKEPLECIYRECGNREKCDHCDSMLAFSEEGFLTCVNTKCGIIYKDILDQNAEWRYYGADDNQSSDPTRCGMPINPLLEESSYGCKVLCGGPMSYEMRKIRRYTEWQSMPYKEKSQYDEFQIITTHAQNAGMPKIIIDDAIRYHKKISEYDVTFRGDNRDGIIAGSIYISCRINNYPRTAKEIDNIFHLDEYSKSYPYLIEDGGATYIMYRNKIPYTDNQNFFIESYNKIDENDERYKNIISIHTNFEKDK